MTSNKTECCFDRPSPTLEHYCVSCTRPAHMARYLSNRGPRKYRSEHPILSDCCSAHDPICDRKPKFGPTLQFLSECHLAQTVRF